MKNTVRTHTKVNKTVNPRQGKTAVERKEAQAWQRRIEAEFARPDPNDEISHPACLAVYDRVDKGLVAKIPLSEKEFADVILANVGPEQGFENFIAQAVREKLSSATGQAEPPQNLRPHAERAVGGGPFIPSQLCEEAQAAFRALEDAVGAAFALSVLNTDMIEACIQSNAGWEHFETAIYQRGSFNITPLLAARFYKGFELFKADLASLAGKVLHLTSPIAAPPDDAATMERWRQLTNPAGEDEVEDEVAALKYLLDVQGDVIGRRRKGNAWVCGCCIGESLEAAHARAWQLFRKIKLAVIAVERDGQKLAQAA